MMTLFLALFILFLNFSFTFSTFSTSSTFSHFDCGICVNTLHLNTDNENLYHFMLKVPSSCSYSTNDYRQQVLCMTNFIEHSKFLYNNLKNYHYDSSILCREIGAVGNPCTKGFTKTKASRNTEL